MLVRYSKTLIFQYVQKLRYLTSAFNRPAFQRMIADIEAGKVKCVVTKDLSRLGRNYIEAGSYIEVFFPRHNVRYIAVTDGVDSVNRQEMDITPFKNILNDLYRLNYILKKNISYNLSIIKIFCQVILPEEKIDGDKPDVWFCRGLGSISSLQKQTHEIISKGHRKELYELLLSTIESTYSIQEFRSAYEFLPDRIRGDYILPDLEDTFSDFMLGTDKMLMGDKIATYISKIRERSSSLPE